MMKLLRRIFPRPTFADLRRRWVLLNITDFTWAAGQNNMFLRYPTKVVFYNGTQFSEDSANFAYAFLRYREFFTSEDKRHAVDVEEYAFNYFSYRTRSGEKVTLNKYLPPKNV